MNRVFDTCRSPFFIYSILLLVKLSLVRYIMFKEFSVGQTLLVELPSILFLLGMVELLSRKVKPYIYLLLNAVSSTIFLAMILYYNYYGTLVTYSALLQVGQVGEVKESIGSLFQPAYLLLFADIVVILVWMIVKIPLLSNRTPLKLNKKFIVALLAALFLACMSNAATNSGKDIVNEMKKAENMGVLTYEVYTAYNDANKEAVSTKNITMQKINKIKRIQEPKVRNYNGIAKNKNLIIVQLEAFQNFLIGLKVDGQEVTPNLNKLIKESFYFNHFNAQIAKGNTSDAEFLTNTSIYPVGDRAMSQTFGNRKIPGLPRMLNSIGYETYTLHTNDVSFWFRNLMYPALGFDKYYDKAYFGDEDVIAFGASDEVLYRKSMNVLLDTTSRNKKFYAHIIAMSSHNPFKIPSSRQGLKLPAKLEGSMVGNYLQAAYYADFALGKFMQDLKQKGLWDETVLAIYGDHFGIGYTSPEEEKSLVSGLLGRTYTRADTFNIPLIIKVPGTKAGKTYDRVGGQVDTMPTIANLFGLSLDKHIYFGQDLLNHSNNLLGQRFYAPTGTFINDEVLFVPGLGFKDGTITKLPRSKTVKPLAQYEEDFNRILELMKLSDGYVNSLPLR